MARNNFKDLTGQPAFISAYEAVCKTLGLGNGGGLIDELSLGDLFWSCADAIFEQVPAAVPSFSVACILEIHQFETLPSFCNFLCKEEKTKTTVDESSLDIKIADFDLLSLCFHIRLEQQVF